MAVFVHAKAESAKKERVALFSNPRMIGTKCRTIFSGDMIMCFCMIIVAASLMLVNSYYKAYKRNLERKITVMLEETKEAEWQKSVSENRYLEMTSSDELMKKAKEMKLTVATSDKFIKVN